MLRRHFRPRRDNAENWQQKNPILKRGELGHDITNGHLKIGDGVTPWNDLTKLEKTVTE